MSVIKDWRNMLIIFTIASKAIHYYFKGQIPVISKDLL